MSFLEDNPLLLLFVVSALGVLAARVRVGGFSLGVAAVLFVGIAAGAIDGRLAIPDEVWTLGLVLFVYSIGLASGPGFLSALRRRGLAANAVTLAALCGAALLVVAIHACTALAAGRLAGAFTGAETSTPALAGVLERVRGRPDELGPVIGYSLSYPLGVLVPMLAVWLLLRRHRRRARPAIVTRTIAVEHDALPLGQLRRELGAEVSFGRLRHEGELVAATDRRVPHRGDLLSVVGRPDAVRQVAVALGREADERIETDRAELDFRRIVVSSRRIAGLSLAELELDRRFGATVTRVRRGDVDVVAGPEMTLELGDAVRVVAPTSRLGEISRFFGDSFRALGEVDLVSLSLGIAAGLALGLVPFPLPGGGTFELGVAGGPLLVALVLGSLGRTGPLVWQLPYTASLTLRQLGLVLFFAGIGVKAGGSFGPAVSDPSSVAVAAVGVLVTTAVVAVVLSVGVRVLRLAPETLAGVIAGTQTQPAVLAFAAERLPDDRELNLGYASVYPLAIIAKIVIAQLLV
jgi:putative transport protein